MNDDDFADVGRLVLTAARTVPPHHGDLDRVRRNGFARRRRRMFAVSLSAAAALAAVVAAAPLTLAHYSASTNEIAASSSPKHAPVMAQRLFVNVPGETMRSSVREAGILGFTGEMLADGSFRELPKLSGLSDIRNIVSTPDGGWAVLGFVDLKPGVQREDGPCVSDVATPLIILGNDAVQRVSRDVYRRCHPATLVGVHSGRAFMLRGDNVVVLDLVSGQESVYLHLSMNEPVAWLDGDTLTVLGSAKDSGTKDKGCQTFDLLTINVVTGAETSHRIKPPDCAIPAEHVRVSPDGARVAFVYTAVEFPASGTSTVAIVSVSTGRILASHKLPTGFVVVGGLAWVDNASVRVVYAERQTDGVHSFRDVAKTVDVRESIG